MTPFPEAEIMTIKRLEVALRKMDFKLLKDGAYKLHEKFHSGHKFEYLDLLKDIQIELLNNPSVPSEVRDILSATIDDILSQDNFNNFEQEKVSPLTSLSYNSAQENETISKEEVAMITDQPIEADYNINKEEFEFSEAPKETYQEAPKINAFDAFSPQKPQDLKEYNQPQSFFTQSPFSAEPFKEFNNSSVPSFENEAYNEPMPEITQNPTQTPIEMQMEVSTEFQEQIQEEPVFEVTYAPAEEQNIQTSFEQDVTYTPIEQVQEEEISSQEKKSIAIVYCQDNSREKIKNILQLKEIIKNSREKNTSIDDLMALISEITTQANTNVIELQGILKQLKASGNKTSLITNSQSEMLIELLDSLEIDYSFSQNSESDKLKLTPLYGLSNLFYCAECGQVHLDKSSEVKPLVLECPQCKNPMYPDFWAATKEAQLNLENYNKGLVELANSKIWLVIHPTFADKTTSELIESALKVGNCVEEIYVLDKDINTRENYKNFISKIKPDLKVNAHNNTLEEFFKII